MRERELKLGVRARRGRIVPSLPMRERELKLSAFVCRRMEIASLPMRERELKRLIGCGFVFQAVSLPMRERVREAGLLCPRADRYCRAAAGVAVSHQHRTEK